MIYSCLRLVFVAPLVIKRLLGAFFSVILRSTPPRALINIFLSANLSFIYDRKSQLQPCKFIISMQSLEPAWKALSGREKKIVNSFGLKAFEAFAARFSLGFKVKFSLES
jgi:hypothetical protein